MTEQEAHDIIEDLLRCQQRFENHLCVPDGCDDCKLYHKNKIDAYGVAISALEKVQKYEKQWLYDIDNPLEPLKLASALNSEIFKYNYRKEHKPKDINILDITVICALQDCLKRYSEGE